MKTPDPRLPLEPADPPLRRLTARESAPETTKTSQTAVFVTAAAFFLAGVLITPLLGVQNDEAIFSTVLYGPIAPEFRLRAFGHDLPLMIMTYLGALKAWLYAAIWKLWDPSIWSLRIPMILVGAATIPIFAALSSQALQRRPAGILAALLLASDPSYLLTTVFDWGPVVLQHFFLVSGVLLLLRFAHTGRDWPLAAGFACLGLGLWDKALLSWSIFGLGVATLTVFTRQLLALLTWRRIGIAIASFLIGAAPLALYNIRHGFKTFRSNAKFNLAEIPPKWVQVKSTLDGSALFGYLVREEWEIPQPPPPVTGLLPRASFALRQLAGERRFGWGYWLFLASALAVPLWWRPHRRLMTFLLTFLAAAWLLMAATHDAGGSAHHVVLLWPMPQLVCTVALTGLWTSTRGRPGKLVAATLAAIVIGQNLLVINQYYTQATRACGGTVWTDAIDPLRRSLAKRRPLAVNALGWGAEFTLTMLERGRLPLRSAAGMEKDPHALQAVLEEGGLFFAHAPEQELTPGAAARFANAAAGLGYTKQVQEIVLDRCGRSTFEIWGFAKTK